MQGFVSLKKELSSICRIRSKILIPALIPVSLKQGYYLYPIDNAVHHPL